jgi:hypothetical protein
MCNKDIELCNNMCIKIYQSVIKELKLAIKCNTNLPPPVLPHESQKFEPEFGYSAEILSDLRGRLPAGGSFRSIPVFRRSEVSLPPPPPPGFFRVRFLCIVVFPCAFFCRLWCCGHFSYLSIQPTWPGRTLVTRWPSPTVGY